jgi:hypothetical protein
MARGSLMKEVEEGETKKEIGGLFKSFREKETKPVRKKTKKRKKKDMSESKDAFSFPLVLPTSKSLSLINLTITRSKPSFLSKLFQKYSKTPTPTIYTISSSIPIVSAQKSGSTYTLLQRYIHSINFSDGNFGGKLMRLTPTEMNVRYALYDADGWEMLYVVSSSLRDN